MIPLELEFGVLSTSNFYRSCAHKEFCLSTGHVIIAFPLFCQWEQKKWCSNWVTSAISFRCISWKVMAYSFLWCLICELPNSCYRVSHTQSELIFWRMFWKLLDIDWLRTIKLMTMDKRKCGKCKSKHWGRGRARLLLWWKYVNFVYSSFCCKFSLKQKLSQKNLYSLFSMKYIGCTRSCWF